MVTTGTTDTLVYAFDKNRRERVHASLTTYKGRALIALRAFYLADSGEYRPTPKGLVIDRTLLPELEASVAALRRAVDATASEAAA